MFSKSLIASILCLGLTSSVNAHALINPALGVKGTAVRGDVQRPSTADPCGNVNIAQTLGTSTPVVAAADGTVSTTVVDFNAGADGSRSIKSVEVDASGTGKSFVAGKVVTNGNAAPTTVGTDKLVFQLPTGTKCTGGPKQNLCVASLTTTAGFGNCIAIQQGGAAPAASPANASAEASPSPSQAPAKGSDNASNGASSANPPPQQSASSTAPSNSTSTPQKQQTPANGNVVHHKQQHDMGAKASNQTEVASGNVQPSKGQSPPQKMSLKRYWSSRPTVPLA
ncbi:hypothetical protein BC834DRAFT_843099 [Gloeopeniophorella convolvens]|nr:hypothetical protein BC834DRAFT_843099 [Gloeopeniophorella convolvens]